MFKINQELSYIDKLTLMNHIKNLAKKDLQIEADNTPYMLDFLMDFWTDGCTTDATLKDGSKVLMYVKIKESLEIHQFIDTILHETKHVEQFIHQPLYYRIARKIKRFLEKHNLYNGYAYLLAMHEIAARRYARKTMRKYRAEITNMINRCCEGTLDELLY